MDEEGGLCQQGGGGDIRQTREMMVEWNISKNGLLVYRGLQWLLDCLRTNHPRQNPLCMGADHIGGCGMIEDGSMSKNKTRKYAKNERHWVAFISHYRY